MHFGGAFAEVRSSMRWLAKMYEPKELEHEAFHLYERFRPRDPEGFSGRGVKGDLDIGLFLQLIKQIASEKELLYAKRHNQT